MPLGFLIKTVHLLNPWWEGKTLELGIKRDLYLAELGKRVEKQKEIVFLLGSRRVGKSFILFQFVDLLIKTKNVPPSKILFLNLDNTNLQAIDLFSYLSESDYDYIFLDEVHNFPNWSQILKSLYDLPTFKAKIICSGSSSVSIEDHKAFLTGRNTTINVNSLTFAEFLNFNKGENQLEDYLRYGGYPEYVLEKQPNYLNELLQDIVSKDIMKAHDIKNSQYMFDICHILARQVGFTSSSHKVANILGLDNKTVTSYSEYLQEVRLVNCVYQFSESLNKRLYAPKKYYFSDLGMRNSFTGFSDMGSLAENAIFLKLIDLYGVKNVFYGVDQNSGEIDFVIKRSPDEISLMESKYVSLKENILNSLNRAFTKDLWFKTGDQGEHPGHAGRGHGVQRVQ